MPYRMRAHHLYCGRYIPRYFAQQRGETYKRVESEMIDAISPGNSQPVELVLGTDMLCPVCPECRNNRCEHPRGNEEEVRKWDAIICKEMGWKYGTVLTGGQWWDLAEKKRPLDFCRRCNLLKDCSLIPTLKKQNRLPADHWAMKTPQ
jgi:hypothetical protein